MRRQPGKMTIPTQPYEHQKVALRESRDKKAWAWFMDMGTGKTLTAILDMCRLFWLGKIDGCLIVAPKGVYLNWYEREIPQHISRDIFARMTYYKTGASKKHRDMVRTICEPAPNDTLDIFIMNVEAIGTKRGTTRVKAFLESHTALMIIDESSTIKNIKAKRTVSCIAMGEKAKYRRILTGTPTPNGPLDIFSQYRFLDKKIFGDSFYSFRARYANLRKMEVGPRSFQVVESYKQLPELRRKVKRHSTRFVIDDCVDLPPKTYLTRDVEMSADQYELYHALRRQGLAELSEMGDSVTATHVLTRLRRLQEITWGYVTLDTGEARYIPTHRHWHAIEWAKQVVNKGIIWCHSVKMIYMLVSKLQEHFGSKIITYYSDDPFDHIKEFEENPDIKFIIANPMKGGMGIELLQGEQVLYFTNSFNYQERVQSERRNYRNGQDKHVTYTDLITRGTIDEKIVKALITKYETGLEITGDNWKEWLEC